jgi:UDP-N-acetylmuramyl pentapeptide phosphotransferase/UDP-N-acetylglucosamine-1-phosphate transferase
MELGNRIVLTGTLIGAFVLSWVLGFVVHRLLRSLDIIDLPNDRSSHDRPVIRGGGIAIIAVIVFLLFASGICWHAPFYFRLAVCCSILAFISFFDDARGLSVIVRFISHVLLALVIAVQLEKLSLSSPKGHLVILLTFAFVIVGYTNAFNFMDGINGLAASQAFMGGLGSALVSGFAGKDFYTPLVFACLSVAGAAAGFMPHNFPRARMFMGDVGSAPLGFTLAALGCACVAEHGARVALPILVLHAGFILDTSFTLLRRVARGDKWYKAHHEHFYQRLVRSGKSHTFVTIAEILLNFIALFVAFILMTGKPSVKAPALGSIVLLWCFFFFFAELRFQRKTGIVGNVQPKG